LCYYEFRFNLGKGNTSQDVDHAIDRGVNYLNWCGHPDGMSQAIRQLSNCQRGRIVIATQFFARCQDRARRELDQQLKKLDTSWIDVLTFYYVETENEWETVSGKGGALGAVLQAMDEEVIRFVGLTTHQRKLAARRAERKDVSLLMIRYNAAHLLNDFRSLTSQEMKRICDQGARIHRTSGQFL